MYNDVRPTGLGPRPSSEPASDSDVAFVAKTVAFPVKTVAYPGFDVAGKIAERSVASALNGAPVWLVDTLGIVAFSLIMQAAIWGLYLGYVSSGWKLLSGLVAHYL